MISSRCTLGNANSLRKNWSWCAYRFQGRFVFAANTRLEPRGKLTGTLSFASGIFIEPYFEWETYYVILSSRKTSSFFNPYRIISNKRSEEKMVHRSLFIEKDLIESCCYHKTSDSFKNLHSWALLRTSLCTPLVFKIDGEL